jgi:hypothetical protein
MDVLTWLLYPAGAFTLALGVVHLFMPVLLDFRAAIPLDGADLRPLNLRRWRYATLRSDIYGIAWVMNHAASYVLISIGLLDLGWTAWLNESYGPLLALWLAGWWFVRAGSQLYLGRRRGDWLILGWFAALGALHVGVALT